MAGEQSLSTVTHIIVVRHYFYFSNILSNCTSFAINGSVYLSIFQLVYIFIIMS